METLRSLSAKLPNWMLWSDIAGGTTPFVHGALRAARQRGATTVFIACVPVEQVSAEADIDIRLW